MTHRWQLLRRLQNGFLATRVVWLYFVVEPSLQMLHIMAHGPLESLVKPSSSPITLALSSLSEKVSAFVLPVPYEQSMYKE